MRLITSSLDHCLRSAEHRSTNRFERKRTSFPENAQVEHRRFSSCMQTQSKTIFAADSRARQLAEHNIHHGVRSETIARCLNTNNRLPSRSPLPYQRVSTVRPVRCATAIERSTTFPTASDRHSHFAESHRFDRGTLARTKPDASTVIAFHTSTDGASIMNQPIQTDRLPETQCGRRSC